MGLDVYITRIKKPVLSGKGPYLEEALLEQHIYCRTIAGIQDDFAYKEAIPYMLKAPVTRNKINIKKIAEAFDLQEESVRTICYSSSSISFGGKKRVGGMPFSITLSREQLQKGFFYQETEDCYLYSKKDVCWWSGHREEVEKIQNYMYDHFPVENCGYYLLTEEHLKALNELLPADNQIPMELPDGESALFYQEWY